MQSTLDFLAHVLPDEGWYVCFSKQTKRQFFTRDLQELAARIISEDQQGRDVYHGCASYAVEGKRKSNNTHFISSFWLDIDYGRDKDVYRTSLEAQVAVFEFCQTTGLPPPTLVGTGGGLHVYWPLAVHLDRGSWLPLAHGLGRLCGEKGLAVDPARTHDAASILRTPGTHNRKYADAPEVACGKLNGPYELGELDAIRAEPTKYVNGYEFAEGSIAGSLQQLYEDRPSDGRQIAARCNQLRTLLSKRGHIPEPTRYACFGVLAYCQDGEQIALENNNRKNHDAYTLEEIQAKFEQWRSAATGPTTCEHFGRINPAGCAGCPHQGKITSPIVLGRDRNQNHAELSDQAVRMGPSESRGDTQLHQSAQQTQLAAPITLPIGFAWGPARQLMTVHEETVDGQLRQDYHLLSTYPLYLERVQTGEIRGDFNLIFNHSLPDLGPYEIALPSRTLFGPSGGSELAAQGANVHDFKNFLRYTRDHLDMLYRDQQIETQYEQFGWKEHDTAFLCGLDLYTPDGVYRVPGSDELRLRSRDSQVGPAPGGSADAWTDAVEGLFAKGHEPQSAAILASFGAPLVRFLDREEGGAVIHWVSAETGRGKTWGLMGAWTVWGRKDGLGLTNKDTKTTKGLSLGALGNLPVFHDELTNRDPSIIREFIEVFTDGRDKLRATRAGEIRHTNTRWQTLLLSAANVSIYDLLTAGNIRHAMAARVIELPGVEMKNIDYHRGDQLKKIMLDNSGWAGHVYLQYLVRPDVLPHVKKLLDVTAQRLWNSGRFDNTHRYWVRALAAMDVGGNIAKHIGLIRADVSGRIMPWLMEQAEEKEVVDFRPDAVAMLAEYIRAHREHTLVMPRPWRQHDTPHPVELNKRELLIRYEIEPQRYLIAQGPFQEWVTKRQQNYRQAVKWLMERRIVLSRNRPLTLGAGTANPGAQVTCLIVHGGHRDLSGVELPAEEGKVVDLKAGTR